MKFTLNERIITNAGKKEILTVLSSHFKKVSESAIQKENLVGVVKIEAFLDSFRNDLTVIRIKENEDGFLLTAEVDYRPTAWFWLCLILLTLFTFIGELIPLIAYFYQKNTVHNAIQNIFTLVKNEFHNIKVVKASSNTMDIDQLEKLHSLKEKGIITEEEFTAKKKEILSN